MNSNMFSLLQEDEEVEKPVKQTKAVQPKKEKPKPAPVVQAPAPDYNPAEVGKTTSRGDAREHNKDNKDNKFKKESKDGVKTSGGRPPKREFDKHSGTGRGKEVKKGGSGANNWGNPNDESENTKVAEIVEEVVTTEQKVEEVKEVVVEPEDLTVTFEEYLKQREEKKTQWNSEAFGVVEERKADTNGLEGLKICKGDFDDLDDKKKHNAPTSGSNKTQRSSAKVVVSEVGFKAPQIQTFDKKDRKSQDRKPRNTSGQKKTDKVDIFNTKDFPSLKN